MRSDNNQVFPNSIEISEEEGDLKMTKNHDSLEDPPVFYMDKNVTACELPESVVSNYKELTYNVATETCVDESLPLIQEKISVEVNLDPSESKSSENVKFEEYLGIQDSRKHNQENLIATKEEVKVDSEVNHGVGCKKPPSRNVVLATSVIVSKETLTLRDFILMEDSPKPEKVKANNLRDVDGNFDSHKKQEPESGSLNDVLADTSDHHHLFSRRFANGSEERSFFEGEPDLAHITYSGPISVTGSLSVGSDGSTVSAHSFAFPILQAEWNSSPVRMVKPETRQLRKKKGWRHYSHLLCCRF